MRVAADFLIEHASLVATCAGPAPRRGAAQRDITPLRDAVIASHQGVIVHVGPASEADRHLDLHADATRLDASGCTVVPGFVDPHTHVVFAGDRQDELRRRLQGATYEAIAAEGGGIMKTVASTGAASDTELADATRPRLDEMLAAGTTTCEAKSGYGLTTESELAQLRAIRRLNRSHAMDIVPTFLGAHEIPREYKSRRGDYVACVIDEMIPRVASEGLAEWCDVFCDTGFFTPEESVAILEAGKRAGLMPRIHADQLATSGGCRVAADVGARSADHLVYVDEAEADALASAGRLRGAAALRGVLLEAGPIRAGAHADRPRRAGGAGDRREPGRRLLAVDAVRDDAGLLRHAHDARGIAHRRDAECGLVARSR